jgi:dipeptidyl aminopeptidase/acylaminoacyl peptidase
MGMQVKQRAPYGTWTSPITADMAVEASIWATEVRLDGEDTYWIEMRPAEKGRCVIVKRDGRGRTTDINPAPFNARTRVHEYGGGAYAVRDGVVYFSSFEDNRVYCREPGGSPQPVTAEEPALRYADFLVDTQHIRLIAVREDHRQEGREAVNTLVMIDLDGGQEAVIASGNDFYSSPRLSPDGTQLAYLTWNHPNLPWDGTDLMLAEVAADGTVSNAQQIAGGRKESIFQPQWSPDGTLYFVSDRTGWWNIYRWADRAVQPTAEVEAELGTTQWVFGMSTYAIPTTSRIVAIVNSNGTTRLASLDPSSGTLQTIDTPYTTVSSIQAQNGRAVFLGASATEPSSVVQLDLTSGALEVLMATGDVAVDTGYLSVPEPIEFPTENGKTAYGLYYPPANKNFEAPEGERPPLIVHVHGGPTGQTTSSFDLGKQFWTSRGFALVDVNYGGSSGYGREFRERLYGKWGVVDVDDSVNAARYLAEQGRADSARQVITGGSAGGYTTLAAMAFKDVFDAGSSYFGVSDLVVFARTTHKFESRYLDQLLGPVDQVDLYRERSPVSYADQINRPLIIFQGLEDKVVPPQQAEIVVEALERRQIPYAYIAFEGEGHGFRRSENIKRTLTADLYFFSRVFGFHLPEEVEPVEIHFSDKLPITAS